MRAPVNNAATPRFFLAQVLLCFFLSGAAGLVYQVAWGKALGLVFGHTVFVVATVLAVFMGGLALGSDLLGRWSERHARPVALYGWLELAIAATGALSLVGLAGVRSLYPAAYHAVEGSAPALVALRFLAAAGVLLPPTFLMGGTFPILVRGVTRSSAELGVRLSRLYWVNTLGAVAGTLAAGFLLLPLAGLRLTIAAAVALNLLAGAIALRLRGVPAPAAVPEPIQRRGETKPASARFLLGSFALVGATGMAYEVAWSRMLASTLGSSIYAFTLMLVTFLIGIVVGSALFEGWVRRGGEPSLATYARTQTLTGLAALAFLVFFQRIPLVVPAILRATGESFPGLLLAEFVTSALAMLPAAILFGFNFPVVTVLAAGGGGARRWFAAAVGRAYAANTLGAILGATAAGFWLIPRLGAFRVVGLLAAANLLLALALELRRSPLRVPALAASLAVFSVVAGSSATGAFYDRTMANFNAVLYWDLYESPLTLAEVAATTDYTFVEDGLNATVTVARTEDYVSLRTNGKVDASNRDALTQLLAGHLGAFFHPAPRRVLVIGFGSGMTVSAVARHPGVERIDCVEIEPAVLRAAPQLESLHRGVLRDPRLRIHLDDGRNFLLTRREPYDLIISEPSNPWIAGVATLFTDEFYREVRARLAPGGLLVQWVQSYALFPEDLRMVLGTLVPHFPQVTLWRGEEQDLLLLAQVRAEPLRFDRLRALWSLPEVRADCESLGLRRPEGLAAFHLLDDPELRRWVVGAPRNTDDRTRLEYHAPRSLLADGLGEENREQIRRQRAHDFSEILRTDDRIALSLGIGETLLYLEDYVGAERFLGLVPPELPLSAAELARARLHLANGKLASARQAFQRALELDPASLEPAHGLAEAARRLLNYDQAELLLRQVLARQPRFVPALKAMAQLESDRENWPAASHWQRRLLEIHPEAAFEEYAELGLLRLRAHDASGAERAFRETLSREPYSYTARRFLGEICRAQGRWEEAREHLEAVERYHPTTHAEPYLSLAVVYRMLGRPRDADRLLAKARRLFPGDARLGANPAAAIPSCPRRPLDAHMIALWPGTSPSSSPSSASFSPGAARAASANCCEGPTSQAPTASSSMRQPCCCRPQPPPWSCGEPWPAA